MATETQVMQSHLIYWKSFQHFSFSFTWKRKQTDWTREFTLCFLLLRTFRHSWNSSCILMTTAYKLKMHNMCWIASKWITNSLQKRSSLPLCYILKFKIKHPFSVYLKYNNTFSGIYISGLYSSWMSFLWNQSKKILLVCSGEIITLRILFLNLASC